MSPNGYLILHCALILIGALAGGYLPFFGHMTHGKLQIYVSTAAGVMLGGSVVADAEKGISWWPGFALFLAIVLHKPADALAISTVLSRKRVSGRKIALVQLGFGLTVAAGVLAFRLTLDWVFDENLKNQ